MKNRLRKELMKVRNNLSKPELMEKSDRIKKRLFEMYELKKSSTILFYISYDNEVHTHKMIKESMSNGKRIVVPSTFKKNRRLIPSELKNWNNLTHSAYNILEPRGECITEVSLDSIDLILVPGIGFGKNGHRLGHGIGYYDKLLENVNHSWVFGLAFEFQILDIIPTEKHDIPVNKIITEERTITCSD